MNKKSSIRTRVVSLFIGTSLVALIVNMGMYLSVNRVITQLDSVYASNTTLNDMTGSLKNVQNYMYQYLDSKSSESLERYYEYEQKLQDSKEYLSQKVTDSSMQVLEYNIRKMTQHYLSVTNEAVQAKRGRNIDKYGEAYKESVKLYQYLTTYITKLNTLQYQSNSDNYNLLRNSIHVLEVAGMIILLVVIVCDIIFILILMMRITRPLTVLASQANLVARGQLDVAFTTFDSGDEVEVLSKTFETMMISIRKYIEGQRESLEKENALIQQDLMNQTLLKDAQLKYLQSQINPHFLFNTLNAGMQLATLEDAEQTAVFIENMAEFFRYNLSKNNQETTLADELELVDHYMYILNVRFAGAIHFEKDVDESVCQVRMPSMILQPLIENAYQYGIRNQEEPGTIWLEVKKEENCATIYIRDNGAGMTREQIDKVLEGTWHNKDERAAKKSNGVGVYNVLERLRMFYECDNPLQIRSDGLGKGTEIIIYIPLEEQAGEQYV